ncbi:hypothetical protein GCM10017774_82950 [Lentzea cavernae]|uniref:Uncharacterized protein n=2 Tax=Lentzea cavernae TaxID=2020703 RepID=A0ABQ3MVJ4_9PSEU|nr:hypothetical protein GCM10017774_82950 [Lentzea cavernae]
MGHAADQVRVGAFHALTRLALTQPEFGQTVADVLCAYLRQPLPYTEIDHLKPTEDRHERVTSRERQVRRTAEQLISDLVSTNPTKELALDLNLYGAELQVLNIANGKIGTLTLTKSVIRESVTIRNSDIIGLVIMKDTEFRGPVYLQYCDFNNRLLILECNFTEGIQAHNSEFLSGLQILRTTGRGFYASETKFHETLALDFINEKPAIALTDSYLINSRSIFIPDEYSVTVDPNTGLLEVDNKP